MPTKASPSGGTASPSAAPQMCSGVWGRQLHGGRLFWFCRKEMVSPSSHPAVQPNEVPRWDVQGMDAGWATWPSSMGLSWGEMQPPHSPASSTARVLEVGCPCGQSPLETRSSFPHPLERATSQARGHHQLRGVAWTEKTQINRGWFVGCSNRSEDKEQLLRCLLQVNFLWLVTPRLKVPQL